MCSDFVLPNGGDLVISGRTLDWETPLYSRLYKVPAGTEFASYAPAGQPVETWKSSYNFVGIQFPLLTLLEEVIRSYEDPPVVDWQHFVCMVDGLNEAGLSAAILWIPGSEFPPVSDTTANLCAFELVTWIVSNYDNTDSLQHDLEGGKINIWAGIPKGQMTMHYAVHDRRGHTLIIEAIDGRLQFYASGPDKPRPPFGAEPTATHVLTNYPPVPWQLKNMYSYINLTPENTAKEVVGQDINGSGLLGLPGDSTPPSRFSRATILTHAMPPQTQTQAGIEQALHVLNRLDVIRGEIRKANEFETPGDYSQWSVVRDHTEAGYYFRTSENLNLRGVLLNALDWQGITSINIDSTDGNWFDDVTSSLNT